MKTDIWMPLYIADYIADTQDLTNSEHGAYLRCLMLYWRKGESLLPGELRAICAKDIDRICRFFVMDGGRWHHKRVDQELRIAHERSEAARLKALKGVESRRKSGQLPPA